MNLYDVRAVSSLEKIFMTKQALDLPAVTGLGGFRGETVSFQFAYRYNGPYYLNQKEAQGPKNPEVFIRVEGELKDCVRIRKVTGVPVTFPAYSSYDDNYLSTEPGLYPDLLEDFEGGLLFIPYQWRSLWVDVELPEEKNGGDYPLTFLFLNKQGETVAAREINVRVTAAALPEQRLIHTEWFYADCLADYYHVPIFSEEHWAIMENFVGLAAKRGVNMILTPLFTPPLDTLIGSERPTVQLVGVARIKNGWSFDFSLLKRWVEMCRRCGIVYFEMSHLFTQWGAKFCPKIEVTVNGKKEKLFGWHTSATGSDYPEFLASFLPALTKKLEELGIAGQTCFHVSDEPHTNNLDTYLAAKKLVEPYLKGYKIIDALSHVEFYKQGVCEHPVPTNDSVHDFIDCNVPDLWVYYCCAQKIDVANRFMAMPSYRNRVLGLQLYKYHLAGFLHWGYNYYYSQYSIKKIDPYRETGAGDAFPAGDSFLVYPGGGGKPEESIRLMVMEEALNDLRACELLESLRGREAVMEMIEKHCDEPLTFCSYPRSSSWLLEVRREINGAVEACLNIRGRLLDELVLLEGKTGIPSKKKAIQEYLHAVRSSGEKKTALANLIRELEATPECPHSQFILPQKEYL